MNMMNLTTNTSQLHVLGGQEQRDSLHSVFNREEASTALALYGAIRSYTQSGDLVPSIGVVSTYAAQ